MADIDFTHTEAQIASTALTAMFTVQQMQSIMGIEAANRLDGGVSEAMASAGKKIADAYGIDLSSDMRDAVLKSFEDMPERAYDPKTYAEGPTIADSRGWSEEKLAEVYGTEYDEAVAAIRESLYLLGDLTEREYEHIMGECNMLITSVGAGPHWSLPISQAGPYVRISDLVLLGRLAYEAYVRDDTIKENLREHS